MSDLKIGDRVVTRDGIGEVKLVLKKTALVKIKIGSRYSALIPFNFNEVKKC